MGVDDVELTLAAVERMERILSETANAIDFQATTVHRWTWVGSVFDEEERLDE